MECLMQYLDDLEDFVYAVALAAGRIRRAARSLLVFTVAITLLISTLMLAMAQPPLGMAIVTILCVVLLYRAAVTQPVTNVSGRLSPE